MRSETIEKRLMEWAAWFNAGGCTAQGGWPTKNILHSSWLPPSGGSKQVLVTGGRSDRREREMHDLIGCLSDKLICAVVVHYCKRWKLADQAEALQCSVSTVAARIGRAHELLAKWLFMAPN